LLLRNASKAKLSISPIPIVIRRVMTG